MTSGSTLLREMSLADELTGLHNRRGFYLLGEQALRDARRAKEPLTVFYFDADGLKKINDMLGHNVGSELLRDIAALLRTTFRSNDVVGAWVATNSPSLPADTRLN